VTSATQRTLAALREDGYYAEKIEYWNPHTRHRIDFLGFLDIVALRAPESPLGVQSAAGTSETATHLRKIAQEPRAELWLDCGCRIEIWAWRKTVLRPGSKVLKWRPRVTVVDHETIRRTRDGTSTPGPSGGDEQG